ncbi:MAG: family 78 glycoside hydrolase catalytic domain, partial [Flavisolibacter sp.]|nr:family 78 glycoside hydrolase catalytic domain [Flavisolibacter sp.]
ISSARLYVCGLGYYEAYLNGQKIGDHVLDPGWTTHKKQALYVTYDITPQLSSGANAIGFMLGNGWWNPLPLQLFGRFNLRNVQQTGRPCVKAQLLLQYADGSKEVIGTNESWQTATGPVIRNNTYLGEHYDARLERNNWSDASYNDNSWQKAEVVQGPSGELTPQMQPPVRITKVIKPVTIKEVGKDTFMVDMGQNFAGVARVRVKGPAGTRVRLRYGEDVHPNGSLNYLTTVAGQIKEIWNMKGGPGAPKTAWQEDDYILKGSGVEQWAPRFTFHGFRYIEITGWPGTPTLNDIEGLRMNSDLQENGTFTCSNSMFNRLQEAIKWTFLSNVFSVQSDCPGREKMGYGADIVVTSEAFLYNFNMANFYRKTVHDYANEQQPDGGITEIAPYTGIADRGYGGESGPLGWQLVFPYLQKMLYDFYGDKRIIEQNYAGIQRQMDFLRSKEINGLFHWDISDHEALDPKPEAFTAAAFYYHHALLAAQFAGILDKKDDSLKYVAWSKRIKDAIVRKYWIPNTGRFDNATQSAQLFALWYHLASDTSRAMQMYRDELARHKGHLSTGIFSTKMLFDVMREKDQNEIAYEVANQRTFPGWGYMLEKSATTLWETWAYPENAPSQNHPMFGSI